MLYSAALIAHSWLRWVVIIAGLVAFVRALLGATRRSPWTAADDRAGFWFIMALDLQIALGVLLYFVSPVTSQAMQDFGAAMKDSVMRFWAVEHSFGMLIGIALAHMGRARARKADVLRRHRVVAILFGLALLAVLLSIPWPGSLYGRPLLRW